LASKDYQCYTAKDFALDEDFQQWVLQPDTPHASFWESWVTRHPEKGETIAEAITLVRSIQFRDYHLPAGERETLWDNVWEKIGAEEGETETVSVATTGLGRHRLWKYLVAASITGLAVFGLWKIITDHPEQRPSFTTTTGSGEIKQLTLPDQSTVMLNANSNLVYSESDDKSREVWLEGEAYFTVKHTMDQKAFIVHANDKLAVEVLGTNFNVKNIGPRVAVVLQKGSIRLSISEGSGQTKLYLQPNEMLEYDARSGDYTKKRINANNPLSWTRGKLVMDHYSLNEASTFLQQVFKQRLVLDDPRLLKDSISGSMPIVYNIDTMLMQFAKVFRVKFEPHSNGKIGVRR
jgi:ferric-dicitrate binding protein FerR (iron transport regulator)